jgi:hypothetical protein
MGYDQPPRSTSGSVVIIVFLLVLVVLGGILVVGVGTWFLVRSRRAEQVATVERHRALEAEQMARAMAKEAEAAAEAARSQAFEALRTAAEFEKEFIDKIQSDTQITVELDKTGKLEMNGEAIDLSKLLDRLKALAADKNASITVDVRADEECQFQHVAALISACQQLEITRFRFGTLEATIAEQPSEEETPSTKID